MKKFVATLCILCQAGMPGCASYAVNDDIHRLQKQVAAQNAQVEQLKYQGRQPDYSAYTPQSGAAASPYSGGSSAADSDDYPDEMYGADHSMDEMYGADYSGSYERGFAERKEAEERARREREAQASSGGDDGTGALLALGAVAGLGYLGYRAVKGFFSGGGSSGSSYSSSSSSSYSSGQSYSSCMDRARAELARCQSQCEGVTDSDGKYHIVFPTKSSRDRCRDKCAEMRSSLESSCY